MNPCVRLGSSLKLTMKTSSSGFDAFTIASAADATRSRLSRMLALLSIDQPSETGTSSCRKTLISCFTPFSKTVNALFGSPLITFQSGSNTETFSRTSPCRREMWFPAPFRAEWFCAAQTPIHNNTHTV